MPPEEDIFHDITDASGFQPSAELPLVWIIIGIGLLCLLILCLAFLIRHFSNQLTETRVNLAQHALEKLPALQEASANQSVQQSASDLSSLLRSTLTFTTKSPSAYQSQQEFHKNADFDLSDQQLKTGFTSLLDSLWELEYTTPSYEVETMKPHYETSATLLEKLSSHTV